MFCILAVVPWTLEVSCAGEFLATFLLLVPALHPKTVEKIIINAHI